MFYRMWEKGEYIYSFEVKFSNFEFAFLPMLSLTLGLGGGFHVDCGFMTFKATFNKTVKLPSNQLKEIMNNLTAAL